MNDQNKHVLDFIERSDLVTDVYGAWPDFSGALMCSVLLEPYSKLFYELGERTLALDFHWWTGAPEHYPDAPRHYDSKELHRRITIAFNVEDIRMHTFHCSDTSIDELKIAVSETHAMVSCNGGFELQCKVFAARVLSILECDEAGNLLENP